MTKINLKSFVRTVDGSTFEKPVTAVQFKKPTVARTKQYIRLLSRKNGITAGEMRDTVGAFTCHNTWSLVRFGAIYGFVLEHWTDGKSGLVRYKFHRIATTTETETETKVRKGRKVANDIAPEDRATA